MPSDDKPFLRTVTVVLEFYSGDAIPEIEEMGPGGLLWYAADLAKESALHITSSTGEESGTVPSPRGDPRTLEVTLHWEITPPYPEEMNSLDQKEPNEGEHE